MKKNNYLERASYTWSEDSIRLIATPSKSAKTAYFYVQEIGYFKTKEPYFTERANLDSYLIIYTLSGKGILKYRGNEYEINKGQCFCINCMEHHIYWTPKGEDWEFLWVHINGNGTLGYYKEFDSSGFNILNGHNDNIPDLIWKMIEINKIKNVTTEIITSNLIHNLITELLILNRTGNDGNVFVPDFIRNIASKIEHHFKEPLTLELFEKEFHRSKYHISKEFKKYIGVTVNEYIIISRISYAKELLKYSDISVSEITFEIGMNNVTHFINLFKARENITPLTYRKKWRD